MRLTIFAGQNRRIIPFLLGFLVLNICTLAQDLPAGKPESVGLSAERLERIGTVVQHDIDDQRIAGAVTLVIRRGQIAWFKSQGMMDREAGKPMRAGCNVPHLLDDQADYQRRRHDALRRGTLPAR